MAQLAALALDSTNQAKGPSHSHPLLHLPLEQEVLPRLPAHALGSLACTCSALNDFVVQAPPSIWRAAAAAVLGPMHPALLAKSGETLGKHHAAVPYLWDSQGCLVSRCATV